MHNTADDVHALYGVEFGLHPRVRTDWLIYRLVTPTSSGHSHTFIVLGGSN